MQLILKNYMGIQLSHVVVVPVVAHAPKKSVAYKCIYVIEMVVFTFFVFFPKELFGTTSLGPLESISSVGTKKSRSHVWHGSIKVIVVTYILGRGAETVVQLVLLVKYTRFGAETQRFPCLLRY